MATKLLGTDTAGDQTRSDNSYIDFQGFTAEASGQCSQIRVRGADSGNVAVALYGDNNGAPGSRLAYSGSVAVVADVWNEISISAVSITQGTKYHIAIQQETAGLFKYRALTGGQYFYQIKGTYPEFPSTASASGPAAYELSLQGWALSASIIIDAPCATSSSQAYAPAVSVMVEISAPCAVSSSLAYAPLVGLVIDISPPAAASSSQAYAPAVSCGCTLSVPAAASTSQAYVVVAGPVTDVDVSAPCALSSSQAYMVSTTVRFHVILEGSYFQESPDVNLSYVVGESVTGSEVFNSAVDQAEVDLVGERMEVQHDPAVPSATVAGYVAAAVLARSRLDKKKANITIPPHCGVELWDVVNVTDAAANQSVDYRVSGYVFEYDAKQGVYWHELDLCGL
ncbi:MAG: hypothetical protein PHG36_06925 [Dehalococcoidia bacterium]|nr:hypothetical protein [Dehalococcoidia bacterium]